MQIRKIIINNFRSIKHQEIILEDYSVLLGANNAGKTNIIRAIRLFYDDIKFNKDRDYPKSDIANTEDRDSWIQITFETTEEEQESLAEKYKSDDNQLTIRKILKSSNAKANCLYSVKENGDLDENQFKGWPGVGIAQLGKRGLIHIDELEVIDSHVKMSGDSTLRQLVTLVFEKISEENDAFGSLNKSIDEFREQIKGSDILKKLENEINNEMDNWPLKLEFKINNLKVKDIIKNLTSCYLKDKDLENEEIEVSAFGQGVQRYLIYVLIRTLAKHLLNDDKKERPSKKAAPRSSIILFEEPELFLHPNQQIRLNRHLRQIASSASSQTQVIITTHSPLFVSKNIDHLSSLVKIVKDKKESNVFQISKGEIKKLHESNIDYCKSILQDNKKDDKFLLEEKELFRYFLWLDSERSALFFVKHVIICEGHSDKVLFSYLLQDGFFESPSDSTYILDAGGKWSVIPYMKLFEKMGISHSVLIDEDQNKGDHKALNRAISNEQKQNKFTKCVESFEEDLEKFTGIKGLIPNDRRSRSTKPAICLAFYTKFKNKDAACKDLNFEGLKEIFNNLKYKEK